MDTNLLDLLKTAITLLLGGAGGSMLQVWLRPKPQKQQEQTNAQRAQWEFERDQRDAERRRWSEDWGWAKTEIKDLRGQVEGLERSHAEMLIKQADLELRQDEMDLHISDLYSAIGQEPDGGAAIKSRLKTQRPARPVNIKRPPTVKQETH